MKFKAKYFFILLSLFILSSCLRFGKQKDEIKEVPFSFTSESPLFNENYFVLKIDSANNYLEIKLEPTKKIKSFPFPKNKNGEALTATAFTFSFCVNGQCIRSASLPGMNFRKNYFGYNSWLKDGLYYTTDTIDLKYSRPIEFRIPFYAFNKLKRGKNNIELICRQDLFCSPSTFTQLRVDPETRDSSYSSIRNYSRSALIAFAAKFEMEIPQIFKTAVYGYGIELRNDSVFSPAGMDNTIWNSSYPDVYWTISFPGDEFYCSSDYQKSTAYYDLKDTFYIYHYTPNDSITLGVWDHDNLSRDDYIAYKRFSLNEFPQGKTAKIPFGNIKAFELKVVKDFAVNQ